MTHPIDRDAIARQLRALVQSMQTSADPQTRIRLASEANALRVLLGPVADGPALVTLTGMEVSESLSPEDVYAHARSWFHAQLQGRALASPIGQIAVSGASWSKIRSNSKLDTLKLRLLPAVPALLARGRHHGREPVYKETPRFVAYHFFTGVVVLPEISVEVGVTVGEEKSGALLYSLNHDMAEAFHKRQTPIAYPSSKDREGGGAGDGEPSLDAIMPESDGGINLSILRVLRRA